ncbi:FecR family protein [Flavivirga abyssicola]|uniref:FecR family protein n=1 Tax=Flavivirga abyssicola TaxID=3063533 RepID=UPI0026E0BA54|nr:FecR family protein [Flavivirga sp. MEBiC07777]WVK12641.1 FecR family protein [Flavivirga sp. MEBiC07777]
MKLFNDDRFLAKWLENKLSDEEKIVFEKTDDFKLYDLILKGTEILEIPSYDKEETYKRTQQKIYERKRQKVKTLQYTFAIAASVILILGITFFFNQNEIINTDYGERLAIVMPDKSSITLNAKSTLKYKKKKWIKDRVVNLKGEAFFRVNKGNTFKVLTNIGSVTVLGTAFTVTNQENIFEVQCFEGQVKVIKGNRKIILDKGKAIRIVGDLLEEWQIKTTKPSWISNESSFYNAPLLQVIKALENNYGITIDASSISQQTRFTGSFTNTDLDVALQIVFEAMDIQYIFNTDNTVVLKSKK